MNRLLGLIITLVIPLSVAIGVEPLHSWQPHEIELTAEREYRWWEFPVQVTFQRQGAAESLSVEAYWDGGRRWVVRVALPQPGTWKWHAQSDDAGLAGQAHYQLYVLLRIEGF